MASGYVGTPFRFSEAKYDPEYKVWVNCGNDRITDYGGEVVCWTKLPEFLLRRNNG